MFYSYIKIFMDERIRRITMSGMEIDYSGTIYECSYPSIFIQIFLKFAFRQSGTI